MHRVGVTALALSLVTGLGGMAAAAAADGHHVFPSKQQVHHARHQAAQAADDVAGVAIALVSFYVGAWASHQSFVRHREPVEERAEEVTSV